MLQVLKDWWKRYFSNPEATVLFFFIIIFLAMMMLFHKILAPVFASIVVAYLLDWGVVRLEKLHTPHWIAVSIVFILFIAILILTFIGLLPLLSKQLSNLVNELPKFIEKLELLLTNLLSHFHYMGQDELGKILQNVQAHLGKIGQNFLSYSVSLIPNIVSYIIYVIMVPLLVFFFLMDKRDILAWASQNVIPIRRKVLTTIWCKVNTQIGNYVRGKVLEAITVGVVTFVVFAFMGLQYSLLLAAIVGLSVFIPYIGAIVAAFPVIIVAIAQWGISPHFWWLLIAFTIINVLDGNILVPLLFAEAVSLHPVVIIVAVLVFGGIFGFWGIFFAIPLAALVRAIFDYWPRTAL